jgi:hypothetical protein
MIKSMKRLAGHAPFIEEKRNVYTVLVEESGGKKHLGRPRRRW